MQCNSSGYSNVDRAAQFGIVSYDWSNAKAQWAKSQPMDCEERLTEQVERLSAVKKAHGYGSNNHIFVYRNLVKALPWFSTVRKKLVDPAYSGFFLKFEEKALQQNTTHVPNCAREDSSVCSNLYHDQEQTPQVPSSENPTPDGKCDRHCDCGPSLPCGEYYFDHRNGTMLRNWLIHDVILTSLTDPKHGNRIVDGLFLDDYWCSDLLCLESNHAIAGCPCRDPNQGPTESNVYAIEDMGLSDKDVMDITLEWNNTMALVEKTLLEHDAYTWWLIDGQENANAKPFLFYLDGENTPTVFDDAIITEDHNVSINKSYHDTRQERSETCTKILKDACREDSEWQIRPRLFGFSVKSTSILQFDLDWAFFLLVRGPYTWVGWGEWGMTWPFQAEPAHGAVPPLPYGVPLPTELTPEGQKDFGVPLGVCYESSRDVFRREWSKGWRVEISCQANSEAGVDSKIERIEKKAKDNANGIPASTS